MSDTDYSFEYISPEIFRGNSPRDFALFYCTENNRICFYGGLEFMDKPGYLYLSETSSELPQEKVELVKSRVLEFAKEHHYLKWLKSESFVPTPIPHALTEEERQQRSLESEKMSLEYQAILRKISATKKLSQLGTTIIKVMLLVTGLVFFAVVAKIR